jgi:hypothetical protein
VVGPSAAEISGYAAESARGAIIEDEIIDDDAPDPYAERRQLLHTLYESVRPKRGDKKKEVPAPILEAFQAAGYSGAYYVKDVRGRRLVGNTFDDLRKWWASEHRKIG